MIYLALTRDLIARVPDYHGFPAVFSDRAPDDFLAGYGAGDKPFAVIAAPTGDGPDDTFTGRGREVAQDVRVYQYDSGSSAAIDALALVIRATFHNRAAALNPLLQGGKVVIVTATGPVASPTTDPALIGRRLTLRLVLEET
jgi:hypothetical protein